MSLDIHTFPDAETAAHEAGKKLGNEIQRRKQPVLLLLSGGSPLSVLDYLDESALGERVTVCALDERFIADPNVNNFLQISKKIRAKNMIETVPREGESLEDFADRYEQALKTWRKENQNGKMIATMGIGDDGHVMGIFPHVENFRQIFDATDRWVVGYDAKEKNKYPLRATTTLAFVRRIDTAIFYVCGDKKRESLVKTLDKQGDVSEVPARVLHEMPNVFLFTDQKVSV